MFALILKVVGVLGGIFAALKANNVAPSLDTVALADITSIQAYEADYASGQAVIIGNLSLNGQAGVVAVMDVGGPAYQALFGSNSATVGTAS